MKTYNGNKYFLLSAITFICSFFLMACEQKSQDEWVTKSEKLHGVKGLEDCEFIIVNRGANVSPLYVVRCGNSRTTSVQTPGKNKHLINVIEDDTASIDTQIEKMTAFKKELEALKNKYGVEK